MHQRKGDTSIGIIGCKGKMGSMLMREISSLGYTTHGIDRKIKEDLQKAESSSFITSENLFDSEELRIFFSASQYIICCVPVTKLQSTLQSIAPYLIKEQHILMDITSVKMLPVQWMEEIFDGQVIGTHPLFGPNPSSMDKKIALVKGIHVKEKHALFVEQLFTELGCSFFWTTAQEHDTGVAFAQSLNFTVSAAFFCALDRRDCIRPFLTPSFKRHLEAARKHLTEDTDMFIEFSSMNPCFMSALEEYRNILAEAASGNLKQVANDAANWYKAEEK